MKNPSGHYSGPGISVTAIARYIHEITGEERSRKKISSHIQALNDVVNNLDAQFLEKLDSMCQSINHIRKYRRQDTVKIEGLIGQLKQSAANLPEVPFANDTEDRYADLSFPAIICSTPSKHAVTSKYSPGPLSLPSIHPAGPVPTELVSLIHVDRSIRTELLSNCVFDIGGQMDLFVSFCANISPESQRLIQYVHLILIEGLNRMDTLHQTIRTLKSMPCLQTLYIDLMPRNLARARDKDRSWGGYTKHFLEALSQVARFRVVLSVHWADDCEVMEREYVTHGRWKRFELGMVERRRV